MSSRDQEQQKALQSIRDGLSKSSMALCVCATGYGKGHLIKLIAESLKEDMTMIVIVPRVNLVRDLSQRTGGSVYCATLGEKTISRITVATKQSLKEITADFIILDEAHNYTDEFLEKVKESCKFLVGFTATPFRENGFIYGENKFWPKPCYEFGIRESIDAGFLCGYEMIGSAHSYTVGNSKAKRDFTQKEVNKIIDSQEEKLAQIITELLAILDKKDIKKCAILCASISHAEDVVSLVKGMNEECEIVHSKIKRSNDIIESWKHNNNRIMVSVMMLTEGFDCPAVDCVAFLRPTKSTRVMIQAVGRGLRLFKGKDNCLLLDYGAVFDNCGTPINPSHMFDSKKNKDAEEEYMRKCSECFFIWETKDSICPSCGFENKEKRDYSEKLKDSLFKNQEPVKSYIFERENIVRQGTTRNKAKYLTLQRDTVSVTLFGKQCNWLYGVMAKGKYAKVFYTTKGNYSNANRIEFCTEDEITDQNSRARQVSQFLRLI